VEPTTRARLEQRPSWLSERPTFSPKELTT
jgi:hypothetical protein